MATLNFPDAPDTGDTYSDANSGFEYEWNGTVWISKGATKRSNIQEIDDISSSFNGSNTNFTLNVASIAIEPVNGQQVVISVGGVLQNVNDDYTIDGSTITFTTAPADGLTFFGTYLNPYLSVNTVGDNTVSTGSLVAGSNYTVGGINVTGVSTLTGLTYTGISSISNLSSSNLAVTGVGTIANVIHTKDSSGLGATMGAAVGIVTYFGDASNLTGVGATLFPYTYSPGIGTNTAGVAANIVTTWSSSIEGGSGTITIRQGSASGTVVDQFVVGSSSSITIAGNELTLNPAVDLSNSIEYFVTYPAGSIKALGGVLQNEQLIYSFTTEPLIKQLWMWGANYNGALGLNESGAPPARPHKSSPCQIPGTTWENSSSSMAVSMGVKTDGTLWTWGRNGEGNLALNSYNPYPSGTGYATGASSPVQVGTDTTWGKDYKHTSASYASLHIKTDGTLWGWGANGSTPSGNNMGGSLGLNDSLHRSSPTQIGTGTDWSDISGCGAARKCAIKTDGTLWVWGKNFYGELGLNQPGPSGYGRISSPAQVGTETTWSKACMQNSSNLTLALKTDGTLWTWGENGNGGLGLNQGYSANTRLSSPTQIGTNTNWSDISSGCYQNATTNIAQKSDGTLWAWGRNTNGYLGLNAVTAVSSPTQVGTDTTWDRAIMTGKGRIAIKTNGTLWSWGYNNFGALGQNSRTDISSPTQVGTATNWMASTLRGGRNTVTVMRSG